MPFPSRENQFRPGQSGNPGGRPKGRSVTARVRRLMLAGEIGGKALPDGKQVADVVAETLLREALSGNFKALKYLIERNDSRDVERLARRLRELESADGPVADDRRGAPLPPPTGAAPAV